MVGGGGYRAKTIKALALAEQNRIARAELVNMSTNIVMYDILV